jgi:hypothetical protein
VELSWPGLRQISSLGSMGLRSLGQDPDPCLAASRTMAACVPGLRNPRPGPILRLVSTSGRFSSCPCPHPTRALTGHVDLGEGCRLERSQPLETRAGSVCAVSFCFSVLPFPLLSAETLILVAKQPAPKFASGSSGEHGRGKTGTSSA